MNLQFNTCCNLIVYVFNANLNLNRNIFFFLIFFKISAVIKSIKYTELFQQILKYTELFQRKNIVIIFPTFFQNKFSVSHFQDKVYHK